MSCGTRPPGGITRHARLWFTHRLDCAVDLVLARLAAVVPGCSIARRPVAAVNELFLSRSGFVKRFTYEMTRAGWDRLPDGLRSTDPRGQLASVLPVLRRAGGGGRDGRDARRGSRPDEQDWAWGMVDDEPAGRSKAPGPQASAVAVAGKDEQPGAFGGGDDFPLDAPGAFQLGAWTAQPPGRGVQQLRRADGAEVFHPGTGVAPGMTAAEQARVRSAGDARDVTAADVEQHDALTV